ncbi:ABC transporter ATP-binding protein [Alteromonas aestuariivivens]|uniref:ABC transporter ATP-binding protein n=1 Tax=Alteromonas aestuariivivens TaxID=1938339 RepID=A0A3D8MEN8_9ALTE|nr:ABC transporter ATP-binding protein [Alteromonas aestuariivivens]RDV29222.1 ABC transporter ATP-binding protein [Alteromonas aestuariivivens]
MLTLHSVTKQFPHQPHPILNRLDFSLPQGHSASIQGPSGSGKSTLLTLIAGFDKPDSGVIRLNELMLSDMDEHAADKFRRQHLGMVFQAYNLLDCFNVWDNVTFTARLKGNFTPNYATELLGKLGLSDLRLRPVAELSGGEQQRVAIARALCHKPTLVLADEPTGNLDEETAAQVSRHLFTLCNQTHTSLVVVTHNQSVAQLATKQWQLLHGQLVAK